MRDVTRPRDRTARGDAPGRVRADPALCIATVRDEPATPLSSAATPTPTPPALASLFAMACSTVVALGGALDGGRRFSTSPGSSPWWWWLALIGPAWLVLVGVQAARRRREPEARALVAIAAIGVLHALTVPFWQHLLLPYAHVLAAVPSAPSPVTDASGPCVAVAITLGVALAVVAALLRGWSRLAALAASTAALQATGLAWAFLARTPDAWQIAQAVVLWVAFGAGLIGAVTGWPTERLAADAAHAGDAAQAGDGTETHRGRVTATPRAAPARLGRHARGLAGLAALAVLVGAGQLLLGAALRAPFLAVAAPIAPPGESPPASASTSTSANRCLPTDRVADHCDETLRALALAPDGRALFTASERELTRWDLRDGTRT